MKRPVELRAAPKNWTTVLRAVYPFLEARGIGDLALFGSSAMSVYLDSPLRSKDLDFISAQFGPEHLSALGSELQQSGFHVGESGVQSRELSPGHQMTTYSLRLDLDEKPFFIEVFDRVFDGKPVSAMTPYIQQLTKWSVRFWVPCINATVALRLAFRPPERISRLNGSRLVSLINQNDRKIDYHEVGRIVVEWGVSSWVQDNLGQLNRVNRIMIPHQDQILQSIREYTKTPSDPVAAIEGALKHVRKTGVRLQHEASRRRAER